MKNIIINFRHSGLVTQNIKESLRFYNKVLGLRIIKKSNEEKQYIEKLLKIKDGNLTTYKPGIKSKIFLELLDFKKKEKKHAFKIK